MRPRLAAGVPVRGGQTILTVQHDCDVDAHAAYAPIVRRTLGYAYWTAPPTGLRRHSTGPHRTRPPHLRTWANALSLLVPIGNGMSQA